MKGNIQTKAAKAFSQAIYELIKLYKKTNRKLAVWEDGKVKRITADKALKNYRKGVREGLYPPPSN